MKDKWFIALAAVFLAFVSAQADNTPREYPVYQLAEEPALDSSGEEPAWKTVPQASVFFGLGGNVVAKKPTVFKAGWKGDNLYLWIYCRETAPDKMKASQGDGDNIWTDDVLELFFVPKTSDCYYQLVVNSYGARWNAYKPDGSDLKVEQVWNWQAKTKVGKDFWAAELKIPFAVLKRTPVAGETWAFNIARDITTGPETEKNSCWAQLTDYSDTRHYARLSFKTNMLTEPAASALSDQINLELIRQIQSNANMVVANTVAANPPSKPGSPPLVNFPANGSLTIKKASGEMGEAQIEKGKPNDITYIPGRKGQGVYLSTNSVIAIPVENLNPAEGTVCFWFRPDWAVGDCTPHTIVEMDARPAFKLRFTKGYSKKHAPDYGYVSMSDAGGCNFGAENLFTARQWRHYTIRWSNKQNMVQMVVDGDTGYMGGCWWHKTGKFKTSATQPMKVNLNLPGSARGAFADVKVFDRFLQAEEIIKEAGLSKPAQFLDDQAPPKGALAAGSAQAIEYVDPATREKKPVVESGSSDNKARGFIYNPANMPDLPITEHTPWARPLAGGPVKILMIMPTGFYDEYSSLREGVELWQRLDSICEIVDANPDPSIFAKDYDVIALTQISGKGPNIAGAVDWSVLSEQFRSWIVDRVKSGKSGLILAYPNPKTMDSVLLGLFDPKAKIKADELVRGIPFHSMYWTYNYFNDYFNLSANYFADPKAFAYRDIEVYNDGRSRAVKLNYAFTPMACTMGFTPVTACNCAATDVGYDYWQALLARAALFAAGRKPEATIHAANVDSRTWTIKIEGIETRATLWYRARDIWNRPYANGEMDVKAPCAITLDQASLPPRTVVDFILKDKSGKTIDWYSASVSPAINTKITAIILDKDAYSKGEDVHGTAGIVTIKPGDYTVTAYLGDHESRRLVRSEIKASLTADNTNQVQFTLKIPESADSLLMRVEIQLSKDGEIIDEHSADCPIPRTTFEGFYALMYQGGNEFCPRQSSLQFRDRFLVNTWMRGNGFGYALLAARNVNAIDCLTHLGYPSDEKTLSEFVDNWENFFPDKLMCKDLKKVMRFRPLFYSLGEEHYIQNVRSSNNPKVNERFRNYMRGKYGTLETLNAEWNIKCTNWDQVATTTPGMPEFERSRFMEHLFADKHATLADYIRKADPLASVGIHTGWDLCRDSGYDYWLLSRGMDSMSCYGGVQNQYARSFFKNYYGHFYHYSIGCVDNARWCPWEMLISGARGMMWYTLLPNVWGATMSDLHLGSDWAGFWPEFKAVVEAGDLLSRTDYIQDQVAIHYSQDSFQAGIKNMTWIHQAFVNLLYDGGVPFKFVSYDQVAEGGLVKGKFPLFIMPHSISLSEKECTAISDYANNGGVVWADIAPGQYNNYGRKLEQIQLKDLFTDMQVLAPGGKGSMKKVGKGLVILADIGNYNFDRTIGEYRQTGSLLDQVIREARIQRPVQAIDPNTGTMANGVWTSGYRCGDQLYAVIARDYKLADKAPLKVRVEFGRAGYIYEMRSGKYLGFNNSVKTKLETARGKVYAILPYKVKDIKLAAAAPAQRGEDFVLKVEIQPGKGAIGKDALHLLRINVTAPNGKEVTAFGRLVKIYGGQGEVRMPVAFNDPAGKWIVQVKDTATGINISAAYVLPAGEK